MLKALNILSERLFGSIKGLFGNSISAFQNNKKGPYSFFSCALKESKPLDGKVVFIHEPSTGTLVMAVPPSADSFAQRSLIPQLRARFGECLLDTDMDYRNLSLSYYKWGDAEMIAEILQSVNVGELVYPDW